MLCRALVNETSGQGLSWYFLLEHEIEIDHLISANLNAWHFSPIRHSFLSYLSKHHLEENKALFISNPRD